MSTEILSETLVLPDGLDPATDGFQMHAFVLAVRYRGEYEGRSGGGWAVEWCGSQLRRGTTDDWGLPNDGEHHHYRWKTRQEALEAVRPVVDDLVVNGRTWAQWQQHRQPAHPRARSSAG